MGAPTVIARLTVSGSFAQVAARLWDVAADGNETLVSQSFYRPRTDNLGPQTFQLHPNGWHFLAGHTPKLELLGQSVPFGRASAGTFVVTVTDLELRLPVVEAPDGQTIQAPAPPVLPPDAVDPADLGSPPCGDVPDASCRGPVVPRKGLLLVKKRARTAGTQVVWKWRKGAPTTKADFGDPRGTTAYRLCLYDGTSKLLWSAALPAGGTCKGRKAKPCWAEQRAGFTYANPERTPDGVETIVLRQGVGRGNASIQLRAERGGAFPALASQPVTVQLKNGLGVCWGAAYRTPHPGAGSRQQLKD
jgi:hypothetical protein